VTPDLSIAGTIGTESYDVASIASDAGSQTYGVEAEYRIDQSPFSLFVAYERADVDASTNAEADSWGLGLRYGFGDASLQARRDEGPRWLRQDRRAIRVLLF
jgi:predicted porin